MVQLTRAEKKHRKQLKRKEKQHREVDRGIRQKKLGFWRKW